MAGEPVGFDAVECVGRCLSIHEVLDGDGHGKHITVCPDVPNFTTCWALLFTNGRRLRVGSGNERPRGVGRAPRRRFDGPLGLELFDPVELLDEPVRLGVVLLL